MSTFIVSSVVSLFETYKAQIIYTEPAATGASGSLGPTGPTGVGISMTIVDSNGDLIIMYTDGTVENAGNVIGPTGLQSVTGATGATGQTGVTGACYIKPIRDVSGDIGATGLVNLQYNPNTCEVVQNTEHVQIFSGADCTGGLTLSGTFQDIDLDAELKKTSLMTHIGSSAEVTVERAGTYVINGYISTETVSGSSNNTAQGRLVRQVGGVGAFTEISGTRINMSMDGTDDDERNTGGFSITLDVGAGDVFKLQAEQIIGGGTCATTIDSGLNIFSLILS